MPVARSRGGGRPGRPSRRARCGFPPLFPIEVRVSAADDIALSTGYGREQRWVAVHQYRGAPYEDYFHGVEAIMDEYGGRPHWGKMHYQTAATLRAAIPSGMRSPTSSGTPRP